MNNKENAHGDYYTKPPFVKISTGLKTLCKDLEEAATFYGVVFDTVKIEPNLTPEDGRGLWLWTVNWDFP